MAKSTGRPGIDAIESNAGDAPVKPVSVYTAAELAKAHKTLGTTHEIVAVALKLAGKKEASLDEAKKIIEEFKNKEVR